MWLYITWGQLGIIIAAVLIPYYVCCFIIFYRGKIKSLFKGNTGVVWKRDDSKSLANSQQPVAKKSSNDDGIHSSIYDLMDELKQVFEAADENSLNKQQVLDAIKYRLVKYPSIKGTDFQNAVSDHIVLELQGKLGIAVDDGVVSKLW